MMHPIAQMVAKNVVGLRLKCFGRQLNATPHTGIIQTGWGQVETYFEAQVPIEHLTARIKTTQGLCEVRVCDTPHFAYAMHHLGNEGHDPARYITYIKDHFPSDDLDKRMRDFGWIIENITNTLTDQAAARHVLVRAKLIPRRRLVIADGLHRCSAALAAGEASIPAAFSL